MTSLQEPQLRIVLYEGPGADRLAAQERLDVVTALLEQGHPVTSPRQGGQVSANDASPLLVLGRFEEDPPQDGQGSAQEKLCIRDLNRMDGQRLTEQLAEEVEQARHEMGGAERGSWKPWFPVIDYDRCTNCMQCLSFCLFDVYGVDGRKRIQVQNESNCKTDCPACSRVCPEAAILFPKYGKGPINGDVVREKDLQREAMKVDITALLGGDIYASLKQRSQAARKRFSTERDESRAMLERKRCLKKLKKDLDIPDEVLMTLPSAEGIEERARRAREKAERRKAASRSVRDQETKTHTPEDWGI